MMLFYRGMVFIAFFCSVVDSGPPRTSAIGAAASITGGGSAQGGKGYKDGKHNQYSDSSSSYRPAHKGFILANEITQNSSKFLRPVRNTLHATNVTFRLSLYQILGADAVDQKIHLHFWTEMSWKNEFISWNPDDYEHIIRLEVEPRYLWIPDITFFNQLSGEHFTENFPAMPVVDHNGTVLILKPFKAELACHLEVTYFPFDSQSCQMEIGSWAHVRKEIDIHGLSNDTANESLAADLRFFKKSSIFTIENFWAYYHTYGDPALLESEFSSLIFTVTFRRRAAYFVMNLIMPSVMINVLCVLNFLIPCDSGEKVGYGITVFLAQSVNLMVVSEMMPQGGTSILGMFLVASILLIGLSLLMQITALRFYHPINPRQRPSRSLRNFINWLRAFVGPDSDLTLLPRKDIVLARSNIARVRSALFLGNGANDKTLNDETCNIDKYQCNNVKQATNHNHVEPGARNRSNSHFISITDGMHEPSSTILDMGGGNNDFWITSHDDDDSVNNCFTEEEISREWKMVAETINRVNAVIFCVLLISIAALYAYFHSPG